MLKFLRRPAGIPSTFVCLLIAGLAPLISTASGPDYKNLFFSGAQGERGRDGREGAIY